MGFFDFFEFGLVGGRVAFFEVGKSLLFCSVFFGSEFCFGFGQESDGFVGSSLGAGDDRDSGEVSVGREAGISEDEEGEGKHSSYQDFFHVMGKGVNNETIFFVERKANLKISTAFLKRYHLNFQKAAPSPYQSDHNILTSTISKRCSFPSSAISSSSCIFSLSGV